MPYKRSSLSCVDCGAACSRAGHRCRACAHAVQATLRVAGISLTNPSGVCQCGCGQLAPIARQTRGKDGIVRGQPTRFIPGHGERKHPITDPPNPSGLCLCGCGELAPIAKYSNHITGSRNGEPQRYVRGHHLRFTEEQQVASFWSRVDMGAGPDACWPWTRERIHGGYGRLKINGERMFAHRVAYGLTYGPIPDGHFVCHRCDNPPCCNPAHLFTGTPKANTLDMIRKGRKAVRRGAALPQAKVTEDDVREIRALWATDQFSQREIGRRFGISQQAVAHIVNRKDWSWVE